MTRALAAAAALGLAAGLVHAQFSPAERRSGVTAWEHLIDLFGNDLGVVSSGFSSDGFEPFERTASAGGYTAIQQSRVTPGGASFVCTAYGVPQSMGYGLGESLFDLVFDLSAASNCELAGSFSRFIGDSRVRLLRGEDILFEFDSPGDSAPFLYQAVLAPGRYRLEVAARSDFGSVTGVLSVPTPAAVLPLVGLPVLRRRR